MSKFNTSHLICSLIPGSCIFLSVWLCRINLSKHWKKTPFLQINIALAAVSWGNSTPDWSFHCEVCNQALEWGCFQWISDDLISVKIMVCAIWLQNKKMKSSRRIKMAFKFFYSSAAVQLKLKQENHTSDFISQKYFLWDLPLCPLGFLLCRSTAARRQDATC